MEREWTFCPSAFYHLTEQLFHKSTAIGSRKALTSICKAKFVMSAWAIFEVDFRESSFKSQMRPLDSFAVSVG
jgi:hypothetical protein